MIPRRSPQIPSSTTDLCGEVLTAESKLWIGYKASQPKVSTVELASNWNIPLSAVKQYARNYQRLYVRTEHTRLEKFLHFMKSLLPKPLSNFLANMFDRLLPQTVFLEDLTQVPKLWKVIIALTVNFGYVTLLLGLVITSYASLREKSFISLQESSGVCKEVVRPTNGEFLISQGVNYSNFAYSSSPHFTFNSSAFTMLFSSFKSTTSTFRTHIDTIAGLLQSVGTRGENRDLAWNVAAWTTFHYVSNSIEGGILSFSGLGDPSALFGGGSYAAAVTNANGVCNASMDTSFDTTTSTFRVTMKDYMLGAPSCSGQFDPSMLQPDSLGVPSPDFTMEFDMVSYMFAVAINYGLVDVRTLVQVVDSGLTDDDFSPYTDDGDTTAFPPLRPFNVTPSAARRYARMLEDEASAAATESLRTDGTATTSNPKREFVDAEKLHRELRNHHSMSIESFVGHIRAHIKMTRTAAVNPRGTVHGGGSKLSEAERVALEDKTRGKVDATLMDTLARQSAELYLAEAGGGDAAAAMGRRLEDIELPTVQAYYSARFLGMDPVFCVEFPDVGRQCSVLSQKTLLYPAFNVLGTHNFTTLVDSLNNFELDLTHSPTNATKIDLGPIDLSGARCTPCGREMTTTDKQECGQTNFVTSFIFFPQDSQSDLTGIINFAFFAGKARLLQYDSYVADVAYTPAMASLLQNFAYDFTGNSLLTVVPGTPIFATNRYPEFYAPLCVNCSMITILKLADASAPAINHYNLKLNTGNCDNTLIRGDSFDNLKEPPLALTERYYECTMPVYDAVFEALGLSIGNAEIIFGVGSILFFMTVTTYLRVGLGYRDNTFESPDDARVDDGTGGYNEGANVATKEDLDVNLTSVTRTVHNVRVDAERQLRRLARTLVVETKVLQAVQGQSTAALDESQRALDALLGSLRKQAKEVTLRGRSGADASTDTGVGGVVGEPGSGAAQSASAAGAPANSDKSVAAAPVPATASSGVVKKLLSGSGSWSDESGDSSDDDGLGGTWSDHHGHKHEHNHGHADDDAVIKTRKDSPVVVSATDDAADAVVAITPELIVPVSEAPKLSTPISPPVAMSVTRSEFVRQQYLIMSVLELMSSDKQREREVANAASESLQCIATELAKLTQLTVSTGNKKSDESTIESP